MKKFFNILKSVVSYKRGNYNLRKSKLLFALAIALSPLSTQNVLAINLVEEYDAKQYVKNINDKKDSYYENLEEVKINPVIENMVKSIDEAEDNDVFDLWDTLDELKKLTTSSDAKGHADPLVGESAAVDMLQRLKQRMERAIKNGNMTTDQYDMILAEAMRLYDIGNERAENANRAAGDGATARDVITSKEFVYQEVLADDCPSSELIRAKYTSGCWSCLIVEKLVSAFLTAASQAYSLSQEAGKLLLGLGAAIWFVFWGLRNVSSFTQLEPGNILNELIKFGFKVALAYAFIIGGLKIIGTYFINPIMGVGAKIAESFWDNEIKPLTDIYDWDTISEEAYKQIDEQIKEAEQIERQQSAQPKPATSEKEQQALNLAKEAQKNFNKEKVPNFIIPPVFSGVLTDPSGCRYHPIHKKYIVHKGMDVAGNNGAKIVASGPGVISYLNQPSGAGYYAKIDHGNGWTTLYFHMQPSSHSIMSSGSSVIQGQVIGYVGNTGASTGPHLHFEIRHNNRAVDPLRLLGGEIKYLDGACNASTVSSYPSPYYDRMPVPTNPTLAWTAADEAIVDLTSFAPSSTSGYSVGPIAIADITYTGPTDILSKAVMNSILGATKAISDITSENMILGDVVMCYASLENGGAWNVWDVASITDIVMWFEGMFFFCTGLLLTLAVAFYLVDISFKIGFAVMALPIAVGLWPFDITKDKVGVCVSIIAKSAAIYAFLAIATTYTVQLSDAVFNYEDGETSETQQINENAPRGLAKLYQIYDAAHSAERGDQYANATEDIEFMTNKLAIFSTTFVLILFAFLYSFKLVQNTVNETTNKFFSDKAFGSSSPMHHVARGFAGKLKDVAAAPAKWVGDAALYQSGKLVNRGIGGIVDRVKGVAAGKGSGTSKTVAGRGARGAGNVAKAAGLATQYAGKGISAVGNAVSSIPFVGAAIGAGIKAAGKGVEVAGNAVKAAGNATKKLGDAADKKYNDFATRNKDEKDSSESSKGEK